MNSPRRRSAEVVKINLLTLPNIILRHCPPTIREAVGSTHFNNNAFDIKNWRYGLLPTNNDSANVQLRELPRQQCTYIHPSIFDGNFCSRCPVEMYVGISTFGILFMPMSNQHGPGRRCCTLSVAVIIGAACHQCPRQQHCAKAERERPF